MQWECEREAPRRVLERQLIQQNTLRCLNIAKSSLLESKGMIRPRTIVASMLVCCAVALSAETLPATEGENLLGQKVKIAESIKGKTGVLVIGYSKSSGDITGAWEKRLSADFGSNSAVTVYQMPMLEAAPEIHSRYDHQRNEEGRSCAEAGELHRRGKR